MEPTPTHPSSSSSSAPTTTTITGPASLIRNTMTMTYGWAQQRLAGSPTPPTPPAPVVWLNGFPGTGKTAIADEMSALLKSSHNNVVESEEPTVVDCVREALMDLEGGGGMYSAEFAAAEKEWRDAAFMQYVFPREEAGRMIIFIERLPAGEYGERVAAQFETAARVADRPLVPVYVVCSPSEIIRRSGLPSRAEALANPETSWTGREAGMVVDREGLADTMARHEIYRFPVGRGRPGPGLTVDTTNISPRSAAAMILSHIQDLQSGVRSEQAEDEEDWDLVSRTGNLQLSREA